MKKVYKPNQIPPGERITYLCLSTFLFFYALFSINTREISIPWSNGRGRDGGSASLVGISLYIMVGAFSCAILNFLSVILDHYDQRNNEYNYKLFGRITEILGWVLFGLSFVIAAITTEK